MSVKLTVLLWKAHRRLGYDALIKVILTMAKSLDLDVIAEGVETRAQLDSLINLGCENFQGYYLATPFLAMIL